MCRKWEKYYKKVKALQNKIINIVLLKYSLQQFLNSNKNVMNIKEIVQT